MADNRELALRRFRGMGSRTVTDAEALLVLWGFKPMTRRKAMTCWSNGKLNIILPDTGALVLARPMRDTVVRIVEASRMEGMEKEEGMHHE